jgi:hypothetical protein
MAATSLSARIVCDEDGVRWHIHAEYAHEPTFGLTIPSGQLEVEGRLEGF